MVAGLLYILVFLTIARSDSPAYILFANSVGSFVDVLRLVNRKYWNYANLFSKYPKPPS